MYKKTISISFLLNILIILFSSCTEITKDEDKDFKRFIKKFKIIQLPIRLDIDKLDNNNLEKYEPNDSIYINDPLSSYFGILKDTTVFYSIITLLPGDNFVPILTTFDKRGKQIDSKPLIVRGCPGGPCINYYSSITTIENNLRIICIDTIIGPTCINDEPILGTDSIFVNTISGKISSVGHIELNEEYLQKAKK